MGGKLGKESMKAQDIQSIIGRFTFFIDQSQTSYREMRAELCGRLAALLFLLVIGNPPKAAMEPMCRLQRP